MNGIKIIIRNDNREQQELLKKAYDEKIEQVVQKMPKTLQFEEKVEYLYDYLVNEMDYDYECLERNTEVGTVYPSVFNDDENTPVAYRNVGTTANYMSAFLHKKALCAATGRIFKDLCDKVGIKCEICSGKTAVVDENTGIRREHIWNIVEDGYGHRSHVDVTYGRFVKDKHEFDKCNGRKIEDFCMVNDDDLLNRGPHTIDEGVKPCDYTVMNHQQIANVIENVKLSDVDAITNETKQAIQTLQTEEKNKKGEEKDGKD